MRAETGVNAALQAVVTQPAATNSAALTLRGAPIVLALTIPARAAALVSFLRYTAGPATREASGITPLPVSERIGALSASVREIRHRTG
jgi:hypothetical protein